MPEREMTPEERKRFEEEVLHHEDREKESGGPASEPEIRDDREPSQGPRVVPNPD
jgi:hypothetical protein